MQQHNLYFIDKLIGVNDDNKIMLAQFTASYMLDKNNNECVHISSLRTIDKNTVYEKLGDIASLYFNHPYSIYTNNRELIIRGDFTTSTGERVPHITLINNNEDLCFYDKPQILTTIEKSIKLANDNFVKLYTENYLKQTNLLKNIIYSTNSYLIDFIKTLNIKILQNNELKLYNCYCNKIKTNQHHCNFLEEIKANVLIILNSTPFTEIEMHHFNKLLVLNFDQKYDCDNLPLDNYDDIIDHFRGYRIYSKKEVFDEIKRKIGVNK